MQQKDSWAATIQSLDQPLATWLSRSYLTQVQTDSILFLDKSNYLILNNLYYLPQLYSVVKSYFPETKSLHLVTTTLLEFIKNKDIDLYSVEVI